MLSLGKRCAIAQRGNRNIVRFREPGCEDGEPHDGAVRFERVNPPAGDLQDVARLQQVPPPLDDDGPVSSEEHDRQVVARVDVRLLRPFGFEQLESRILGVTPWAAAESGRNSPQTGDGARRRLHSRSTEALPDQRAIRSSSTPTERHHQEDTDKPAHADEMPQPADACKRPCHLLRTIAPGGTSVPAAKMRAAYCTGPRRIELRNEPEPHGGPEAVLVRVHACGICGSDLHYYAGAAAPPSVCLGHEIVGRVATPGSGFAAEEPVVVEPLIACGACVRCREGQPNLCPTLRILGSMAPGGFTDLIAVPAHTLYRVPSDLDLDTAMLAEPLAVGIHAAHLGEITTGESVLVLGGGAIGLLAAVAAQDRGARVTVSARHPHQARAAIALGLTTVGVTADEIQAWCDASPPDVVLETVGGRATTLDLAVRSVRAGGRIISLGKFTQPITLPPLRFLMKEIRLTSSMTYCRHQARPDFESALTLLAREREQLARLVTHRVPLADVGDGFAIAADKASGAIKVAVVR